MSDPDTIKWLEAHYKKSSGPFSLSSGISVGLAVIVLGAVTALYDMHATAIDQISGLKVVAAGQNERLSAVVSRLESIDQALRSTATQDWVKNYIDAQNAAARAGFVSELQELRSMIKIHVERPIHDGAVHSSVLDSLITRVASLEERIK